MILEPSAATEEFSERGNTARNWDGFVYARSRTERAAGTSNVDLTANLDARDAFVRLFVRSFVCSQTEAAHTTNAKIRMKQNVPHGHIIFTDPPPTGVLGRMRGKRRWNFHSAVKVSRDKNRLIFDRFTVKYGLDVALWTLQDEDEQAKMGLTGDGASVWFDKCLTIELFEHTTMAVANMEHSGADATVCLHSVHSETVSQLGRWPFLIACRWFQIQSLHFTVRWFSKLLRVSESYRHRRLTLQYFSWAGDTHPSMHIMIKTRSSATAKSTARPSCLVGVLYDIHQEKNNRSTTCTKLAMKPTEFRELTQNNGHYNVQGRSRSPILVPIESPYTTSY